MTEEEWFAATDAGEMLRQAKASERKLRHGCLRMHPAADGSGYGHTAGQEEIEAAEQLRAHERILDRSKIKLARRIALRFVPEWPL